MNYYSDESNKLYMSCSQYDRYTYCEASALNPIPTDHKSTALLLGNYVHTWCEGEDAHSQFKLDNPSIFTKKGELRAEFQHADEMIETIKNDEFCTFMLEGQKEVEFYGDLFGVPWKCRLDVWNPERKRIVDLKTTKAIHEREYVNGERLTFIEKYHYMRRAAVYCEIVRQNVDNSHDFYIVAVSKEPTPDKAIIKLTDYERFEDELEKIKLNLERIKLLREGMVEPVRCERCHYCLKTKKLDKILYYDEI